MSSEKIYECKTHNKKYVGYCQSCNIDICLLCSSIHEKHDLLQYNEIQPSAKKVEELKKNFLEYKQKNKILISKFNLWLEKINHYSNKILQILENNEKMYENILSNYDTNNLIFAEIDNMNQLLRKNGLLLGYKNINLTLFDNDENILEKSDLIFKTIKEMQIEDIYFSIKNQKNFINTNDINNINNIEKKEQEKKENEDTGMIEKKKSNKKKKTNKNKKKEEKENEQFKKKFEEYKEINMKSNFFDKEYLINLENEKKIQEENNNVKSIHNGREINNLILIQHESKKYIVTSGFCYIALYDLKGQLQRSIKLHESDITNLIQLKSGNLLSCCIDGIMKLIQLGKNEGYNVIQTIDTKLIQHENKNNIFSNHQLYVLQEINSNEDIVTAHGNNLLFYSPSKNKDKNNAINYEFNQLLSINTDKKENDYDFILNNKNISSLLYLNQNNTLIALDNTTIYFIEKEIGDNKKYYIKQQIKDICGNGGPNNISIYNNDIIIIGGGNKIYFVNVKEISIINEIKMDFCCINCISIKNINDNKSLYIGYETKDNKYNIGKYNITNKENKFEINNMKTYINAHSKSISNILYIDNDKINENNDDGENNNSKLEIVSGSHDKLLKFWE